MYKPKRGDRVTSRYPVQAYYSEDVFFMPGDIGVVAEVNVPSVWRERVSFHCVDFEKDGHIYRCSLFNDEIVHVPKKRLARSAASTTQNQY